VLVHLGLGRWMIVDSCIDGRTRKQPALEWLATMGLGAGCVELVVVSHWHLDHVRGLSEVVAACTEATVVFSDAMRTEEFLYRVGLISSQPGSRRNVYSEMRAVMDLLLARSEGAYSVPPVRTAKAGLLLLPQGQPVVLALSPSETEVALAQRSLAAQLSADLVATAAPEPNHAAVALWAQAGQLGVVLGSDLEASAKPDRGWEAALRVVGRPAAQGLYLKVPHHGSFDAHSDRLWAELLGPAPVAALTPFKRGRIVLPGPQDLVRLRATAGSLYITASPARQQPYRPNDPLTSTMRRYIRDLAEAEGAAGRVTIRAPMTGCRPEDVTVDLGFPARRA
jgi:hypothetical protein